MRFMNLSKWLNQGYQEEASDGAQENGGAGGGDANNGGGDSGVMLSQDEYAQFQKLLNAGNNTPENNNKKSTYDKILADENDKKQQNINESQIRENVIFDRNFDGFLNDNKALFNFTAEKIREGARDLTGQDLTDELSKTAAKDFFSKKENIELLPERDQQYVEKEIIGVNDKFIDSAKAWALIESAVHVHNKQTLHGQFKDGAAPNATETPNVTAYIQRCKDAGKGIKAAS